jgi:hypothetical protein
MKATFVTGRAFDCQQNQARSFTVAAQKSTAPSHADTESAPMRVGSNSGLTSAPRWPQIVQTKRSSNSDSRTLSDHKAGYIVTAAMDEDPQGAGCHFAEGDFLLSCHAGAGGLLTGSSTDFNRRLVCRPLGLA